MRSLLRLPSRAALVAATAVVTACTPARPATSPAPAPGSEYVVHSRAEFVSGIDSMVRADAFRNAHWGILVVDPERGDTLYSHNAGKLFMPASNQKILTGAVSLARLGPDYRYRTAFVATGPIEGGVLQGHLVVMGSGDPSISTSMRGDAMLPLLEVADSLAARGIRQVNGTIRSGRDAFPGDLYGFGWAWDDFDYAYSAPVDELVFNESFTRVTVRGTTPGVPPAVTVAPTARLLTVQVDATTVAAQDSSTARIQYFGAAAPASDSIRNAVRITGTIVAGDSMAFNVAHRDPTGAYLDALTAALVARGIPVGHQPIASSAPRFDTLHVMQSPTLREILPHFEKPSQNQIGEILFRTLGLEATGTGTPSAGRRVVEEQLVAWGADTAGFAVRDGSGLSRHDYVTPETIVRVLDAMRQHPDFQVFYDALPIAGVDGTIRSRMRNTPAQDNLRAKTGTIDKARALSGYVTTADGRLLVFSTIANNHTVPNRLVERVQDLIGARLAASRVGEW